jgi:hypothetical protein
VLVVDGNNVMGSRPDGWWRDRAGAARRLVEQIGAWATEDVLVYFDGAEPPDMPAPARVEVRFATRRGRDAADDDIAAYVPSTLTRAWSPPTPASPAGSARRARRSSAPAGCSTSSVDPARYGRRFGCDVRCQPPQCGHSYARRSRRCRRPRR